MNDNADRSALVTVIRPGAEAVAAKMARASSPEERRSLRREWLAMLARQVADDRDYILQKRFGRVRA